MMTPKRKLIIKLCKLMGWKDWFGIYSGGLLKKSRIQQLINKIKKENPDLYIKRLRKEWDK